jgi:hypothetical protein
MAEEQASRGPGQAGKDGASLTEAGAPIQLARRAPWRRRRPGSRPGRPPWWEVPPAGYLEVEWRHSPTSPRALRALAKAAIRAGLSWSPDQQLPVQSYVAARERARLVFHARRELPRVTAVASQVMVIDSRLAEAEDLLERARQHRLAAADFVRRPAGGGSATPATDGRPRAPATATPPGQPIRRLALGGWWQAAVLVVVAGGQGALVSLVGRDLGLRPGMLGLFSLVVAVAVVAAAQLAAGGIHRLAGTPDGSQDPDRRRRLDVAVAAGALACGMALAGATARLRAGAAPAAASLALLGLATAVSYAEIPERPAPADADRWRSVVARWRRLQQDAGRRRRYKAALAQEAAAQAMVRQLREELAVLVPQLFAAEQAALLFWRYQVAIGDATQHALEQYLAAFTIRRSRGTWRPIKDWWWGATPAVSEAAGPGLTSIGAGQSDWAGQVAQVTMAAKRVLVRRGLLDITHGLRVPLLQAALSAQRNGNPPSRIPDANAGDANDVTLPPPLPAALTEVSQTNVEGQFHQ